MRPIGGSPPVEGCAARPAENGTAVVVWGNVGGANAPMARIKDGLGYNDGTVAFQKAGRECCSELGRRGIPRAGQVVPTSTSAELGVPVVRSTADNRGADGSHHRVHDALARGGAPWLQHGHRPVDGA